MTDWSSLRMASNFIDHRRVLSHIAYGQKHPSLILLLIEALKGLPLRNIRRHGKVLTWIARTERRRSPRADGYDGLSCYLAMAAKILSFPGNRLPLAVILESPSTYSARRTEQQVQTKHHCLGAKWIVEADDPTTEIRLRQCFAFSRGASSPADLRQPLHMRGITAVFPCCNSCCPTSTDVRG